jgi:hypothetical protein
MDVNEITEKNRDSRDVSLRAVAGCKINIKNVMNILDKNREKYRFLQQERLSKKWLEHLERIGFEVLMAVKMPMFVFWAVTPNGLVGRYQRFGGTVFLNFKVSKWMQCIPPEH